MAGKKALRTRSKGDHPYTVVGDVNFIWPQDPFSPHPEPLRYRAKTRAPYKRRKIITDTHGYLKDDFNPCFHEQYVGKITLPSYLSWNDESGGTHATELSFSWQLEDPIVDCRNISLPIGAYLEDFSARAENHFITLVDDKYSLLNFILEIIELLELNVKLLSKLKSKIEGAIRGFRRMYEQTGNFWLAWNFAIKPTMKDIHEMLNLLKRAEKRLKWLRSRNHKDTKVKYRESKRKYTVQSAMTVAELQIDPVYFEPPPVLIGNPPIVQEWPRPYGIGCEAFAIVNAYVQLTSWAWIRFDIPDEYLEGWEGMGIVMSAMSGLYNPLDVAWEAVPWSWLIDWFRSEAHKLRNKVKTDLNPLGHATIIQAGHSVDIIAIGDVFARARVEGDDNQAAGEETPQPAVPCGQFRYKVYNRHAELPKIGDNPFRLPFEWYNASIIAALIQQKTRRG